MTSNISFKDYFYPNPPQKWEAEDIRRANQLRGPLVNWGKRFIALGAIGTVCSVSTMIVRKLTGNIISSTLLTIQITSLALIALGMYLIRFANMKHAQGLTNERQTELAIEELKKDFDRWPVYKTQKELDARAQDDRWTRSRADKEISANSVYVGKVLRIFDLATTYYDPERDIQPRFKISSGISRDQKLDLLETAYDKGILLHFRDYERYAFSELENRLLTLELKLKKEFPENLSDLRKNMEESFETSIRFLCARLQPLDENKIEFINKQLQALSYAFQNLGDERVFNPTVYLEDSKTVVIRGNCSEIGDITWAIKLLVPLIKTIKVERCGLPFSVDVDWTNFRNKFGTSYPGKMVFVDELSNMPDIWQYIGPLRVTY